MLFLDRFRLLLIGLVTLSVSLPMAWISLGKLVLFVSCLAVLISRWVKKKQDRTLEKLWTVRIVLVVVVWFALSLTWSEAPADIAIMAFAKHSKVLEIAMLATLIRSRRDAMLALSAFTLSQTFFIASSWLMVAGYRVPWATSQLIAPYRHVVYSTYLDQTLMFSASGAVLWHLRSYWPRARWIVGVIALAALVNVLFFQDGRTGYLAALATLTLMVMWQIPHRWRLLTMIVAPITLALVAYAGSTKIQSKVALVLSEAQSYSATGDSISSSGFRLHAWRRSVQAIAGSPLLGHGVGSWTTTVKRIEGAKADQIFGTNPSSNPHQEYLLWGVELGLGGTLLFFSLLASLVRDALQFQVPIRRATISVTLVMAVGCLFNSSLYDALIGDYFLITLGLLLALGLRTQAPETADKNTKEDPLLREKALA